MLSISRQPYSIAPSDCWSTIVSVLCGNCPVNTHQNGMGRMVDRYCIRSNCLCRKATCKAPFAFGILSGTRYSLASVWIKCGEGDQKASVENTKSRPCIVCRHLPTSSQSKGAGQRSSDTTAPATNNKNKDANTGKKQQETKRKKKKQEKNEKNKQKTKRPQKKQVYRRNSNHKNHHNHHDRKHDNNDNRDSDGNNDNRDTDDNNDNDNNSAKKKKNKRKTKTPF